MQKIVIEINTDYTRSFPEKNGLGSADFLYSGTGYIE